MTEELSIQIILKNWEQNDLSNLLSLLGDEASAPTIENIERRIKWLYHSKVRAGTESGFLNASNLLVPR